ncbi:DUF4328 domain-containing protein [Kineococcus sp. GCM10028916]|uniref:DUF4328 domain-containing protein n=1 Tax=Kineococcus sp. GCM10028916 TaxID=3273394 RepID=UPI0036361C3E
MSRSTGQACLLLESLAADVVCAAGLLLGDSLAGWAALLVGGAGFSGGLLAALVVTALWLGRARRNAQRITPAVPHRRAALWAWFGWFTPIAWFFVPRQLVEDVWTASRRRAPRGVEAPLRLWWTVWILAGLAGGPRCGWPTPPPTGSSPVSASSRRCAASPVSRCSGPWSTR